MLTNQWPASSQVRPYCPPPDVGSMSPGLSGWKRIPRPRSTSGFMSGFCGQVIVPPELPTVQYTQLSIPHRGELTICWMLSSPKPV